MKKEKILNQLLKGKSLILIVAILAIIGVFAVINNFKILTDIFKTDELENQIVGEYIKNTSPDENETY